MATLSAERIAEIKARIGTDPKYCDYVIEWYTWFLNNYNGLREDETDILNYAINRAKHNCLLAVQTEVLGNMIWIEPGKLLSVWQEHWRIRGCAEKFAGRAIIETYQEIPQPIR
jgi:hypothetical protein